MSIVENGSKSRELVAGNFRGYREFRIDGETGLLTGISYFTPPYTSGWNTMCCDKHLVLNAEEILRSLPGMGLTAIHPQPIPRYCSHSNMTYKVLVEADHPAGLEDVINSYGEESDYGFFRYQPPDRRYMGYITVNLRTIPTLHSTPHRHCTCGFYGRYDFQSVYGRSWSQCYYPRYVVGVTENTGHTILGSSGYRTTRSRIVAIADVSPMEDWELDLLPNPWRESHHRDEFVKERLNNYRAELEANGALAEAFSIMLHNRYPDLEILPNRKALFDKYPPEDFSGLLS